MIIPVILLVVFLILMVLLRSVLAPLILIATVVLSFGAALGISALLFEYVFGFAGSDPGVPVVRVRVPGGPRHRLQHLPDDPGARGDHALRHPQGRAGRADLHRRGDHLGGLVLAATFLVLGTIPVVFLAELGVAVALGVILDTMIVRSVLVTALNIDLGGKIWWPSKLDPEDHPLTAEEAPAPIETVH